MQATELKKLKIPNTPGVYFFFKEKEIVYIGKATCLRDRVRSYFSKDLIATRGRLLVDMVFGADRIDWQATDTVLEALILEASYIKKYQPKCNTKEKDDKSFNYVVVTKEELPRIMIMRGKDLAQKQQDYFSARGIHPVFGEGRSAKNNPAAFVKIEKSSVFGPFTSGGQLKEALKIIRRIFPFLDDKSKNYEEFYRQINLVPDLNDRKMYLQNIRNIKLFFHGKKGAIIRSLKKEMKAYAKLREFEKAGEIKRQLFALQHINDVALMKKDYSTQSFAGSMRIEAYDIAHMSGRNMVGVMVVVENGQAVKSEYKKFKIRTQSGANDTGALAEVLERRFNHPEWRNPGLIVVDGSTAQINAAEGILQKMASPVSVVSVVKDERHKPKDINGPAELTSRYKSEILLANSEAHRFAIAYHKNMRGRNFLTLKKKKSTYEK